MKKLNLASLLITLILFASCSGGQKDKSMVKEETTALKGDLVIFHAGSLSVPFKEIASEFNKLHPDVVFKMEAAGSRACARKISELNRECDVMASADYTVIDKLLIPDFADWNIKFASNEMALVYHDESKFSSEVNESNWQEILMKSEVFFGRSDPNADPCGYRAVLCIKLAENFYKNEGLAEKMLQKDNNFIRPKETDLLALLETNAIDYIFLYRSVAEQHGLKYLTLPDSINLKRTELSDFYSLATVEVSGKKPGEKITKSGEPMVYGITIPKNAPNIDVAIAFVNFLLEKDKGIAIMEKNGQPSMVPSNSITFDEIPEVLKKFAIK